MFRLLNRVVRMVLLLAWGAAAYGVWTQRERARPLVDYYQLFRDGGWQVPEPLPRWQGEFRRMIRPDVLEAVDAKGNSWRFTVLGLATVNPDAAPDAGANRWFLQQVATNFTEYLKGATMDIGVTSTNTDHTGVGFVYRGAHLAQVDWVAAGWYRLRPGDCRTLPLDEQYALRLASREARRRAAGIWRLTESD